MTITRPGGCEGRKDKEMKYYIFTYRDNAGGGRRYILAASKTEAFKRLKAFLNEHHPFRKYKIELENVMADR